MRRQAKGLENIFKKDILELMREPLEDGKVTISRVQSTLTYPCKFMLIASMNPWKESGTAPLQVYTRCGRASSYPVWEGATSVAYKNNNYTFVIGGRNSQSLGVQAGSVKRYSTNGNGYNGTLPSDVAVWGYTTVCFEKQ